MQMHWAGVKTCSTGCSSSVERSVWDREAAGPIPVTPTIMESNENPGRIDITISARKCPECQWAIRHHVRWCANCGDELKVVQMREYDFYEHANKFAKETGWDWDKAQFNVHSGEKESLPVEKPKDE
jgi:hypothetical protein